MGRINNVLSVGNALHKSQGQLSEFLHGVLGTLEARPWALSSCPVFLLVVSCWTALPLDSGILS